MEALRAAGLGAVSQIIGKPNGERRRSSSGAMRSRCSRVRAPNCSGWSETSWRIARLRDNPECADQEFARATDADDRGLSMALAFDPAEDVAAPFIVAGARPRIAILREQGVNSQTEMATRSIAPGSRGRRAHDRPDRGPRNARRLQGLRRLRRLFLRRRARRRRRLGQDDPAQPAAGREFAAFFGAATRSRSACATAAR
jgi:hypothetical protein